MRIMKEVLFFVGFTIAIFAINYIIVKADVASVNTTARIKAVHPYMCELACLDGNRHMSEGFRKNFCSFKSVVCYQQYPIPSSRKEWHPTLRTAYEVSSLSGYFIMKVVK